MGRLDFNDCVDIALASRCWPRLGRLGLVMLVAVELNHCSPDHAARVRPTNVIVANPTIADVTIIDAHSVVIVGKGFGETEVMVTDHAGRTLLDSNVAVGKAEGGGQVTVYRGVASEDLSCSPRCQGGNGLSSSWK